MRCLTGMGGNGCTRTQELVPEDFNLFTLLWQFNIKADYS